MKWENARLGDLCDKIGSGATPKGGSTVYIEHGVSLIRSQNVYNLQFEYGGLTHITDDAAAKLDGVTIQENDILINITGDSVARTCIVPKYVLPARVNQHVAIIRPKVDELDARFVNYYLASPYMQKFMLGLAVGKGASRNAMTKGMIEDFSLPKPPLSTQYRIADILSAYDDLIENNRRQIKLLEEAAQRLYKEWFVDLHFPGWETMPIVDGLPEGWRKGTIDEVTEQVRRGISPIYNDKSGKSLVINQKCVRQYIVDYDAARLQDKPFSSDLALRDGDCVICSTGAGTIGRVGQVFGNKENCTFDSHVTLVRADEAQIGKNYLAQYLRTLQSYFDSLGQGSTNQTELYRDVIKRVDIVIPNKETCAKYEQITAGYRRNITTLVNQTKLLLQARDALLPKLMSGEIEV